MADVDCSACGIVGGRVLPVGGELMRTRGFTVHGLAAGSPIPGWVVITSNRHVRGVYDLSEAEWAELSLLIPRVMRAQKDVLHAEHVYLHAIGDQLLHAHLHLVPRFAETPERLRGRGAFDHTAQDRVDEATVRRALELVADALSRNG